MMKLIKVSTVLATLVSLTACTDVLISDSYFVPRHTVSHRHATVTTTSGHIHNYPRYRAAPPQRVVLTRPRRGYVLPKRRPTVVVASRPAARSHPRVTVRSNRAPHPSRPVSKRVEQPRRSVNGVTRSQTVTRRG